MLGYVILYVMKGVVRMTAKEMVLAILAENLSAVEDEIYALEDMLIGKKRSKKSYEELIYKLENED